MNWMRAPFPWFGGKRRVAPIIWEAFGQELPNFVDPFCGSLAVLLGRPGQPGTETVNDLDCYVANFWRAVRADADAVATWADWPVNEADLHARHRWLVAREEFRRQMRADPDFFDVKIAGWWVWGLSMWIGTGWCAQPAWEEQAAAGAVKTLGIHTAEYSKRPMLDKPGRGVHQEAARGEIRLRDLARATIWEKRPSIGDGAARGVHAEHLQVPGGGRAGPLYQWMRALQDRLRYVRVCCGDWRRVLGQSVTWKMGRTGVLFDPPYSEEAGRDPSIYAQEDLQVARDVREWCIENGNNPRLLIALCGLDGEHEMPASWQCVPWKASGGYAAAAGNIENAQRERIWFSPACNRIGSRAWQQAELFDVGGGGVNYLPVFLVLVHLAPARRWRN